MKWFLSITLIGLTLLACYLEDIYLSYRPPVAGKAVYLTIRSRRSFDFDQAKALEANREKAITQYIPVFRYLPQRIDASKHQFQQLTNAFSNLKRKNRREVENLSRQLQKMLGVELSAADIINITRYHDLKNLLKGILTIEESILQNKVLDDPRHLMGKHAIEIRRPNSSGSVTQPANELITLEKARFLLEEKVRQLFWQVRKNVLDPVLRLAQATLQPNLIYDQSENNRRQDRIAREYPSSTVSYRPGDVLVAFRKNLNEKDVLLLDTYRKHEAAALYREISWISFTILFMVMFYNVFLSRILADGSRHEPPYAFLLSLLITTIIILKAGLVLTPFPVYVLPFGLLPMLVIALNHDKITATGTTLLGALLVSLLCGPTFQFLLFFAFGGLVAVLVSSGLHKRLQIMWPSLVVGVINTVSIIIFTGHWQVVLSKLVRLQPIEIDLVKKTADTVLVSNMTWGFAGGLAAGPVVLLLLPLLEISWQTASTFKLNRYMDLNRPLMKELLSKAPGTYQHSMTVAYLAQAVSEAIGANTQLLRIGAYYHDIGKMMNPKFFIENQFNHENSHDVLEPKESAKLIINHVRHGMRIGQESGLPKVVVDLILQHHGTQLMEYFFNTAARAYPKSKIRKKDFRYPGPKPQSVEAAVLMITDSVEAASRSLQEPTRKKFEEMVRHILVKRIVEGQFGECDLASRDLAKIIKTLVDALEASFHSRIPYPWQEKKVKPLKRGWKISDSKERDPEDRAFRL
jgi:putative nucleotidyltransferase with HDIG domain